MIAGHRPDLLKFIMWLQISSMAIVFFQIAEPNCGTVFGNPHIYYKSSIFVIPPAIMTVLIGPGT
jgi:hypothetical protein